MLSDDDKDTAIKVSRRSLRDSKSIKVDARIRNLESEATSRGSFNIRRNVRITSALLAANISQPFNSGASVSVFVNGSEVGEIEWHAFQGNRTHRLTNVDVSDYLIPGSNEVSAVYKTAGAVFGDHSAKGTINISWTYIETGEKEPPSTTKPNDPPTDPTTPPGGDPGGGGPGKEIEKFASRYGLPVGAVLAGAAILAILVLKR